MKDHGFDPNKPTVILGEGVPVYLEERVIDSTLRAVAGLPDGTCMAFDFFFAVFGDLRTSLGLL